MYCSRDIAIARWVVGSELLVFGSAYFLSPMFHGRVNQGVSDVQRFHNNDSNNTSVGLRLFWYQTAARIFMKRPLKIAFGYGTSSTYSVYKSYLKSAKLPQQFIKHPAENPHNQYIYFLLENGLIGFFLYCGVLFIGYSRYLILEKPYNKYLLILVFSMTIGTMFNSWYHDFGVSMAFATFLSILMSFENKSVKLDSEKIILQEA